MIELNKPRWDDVSCNVCYSKNDVVEITFRSNINGSGQAVNLCSDCRNKLEGMIELYKLRQNGDVSNEGNKHCKQDNDGARIIAAVLTSQHELWKSAINELCVREANDERVKNEMVVVDDDNK